MATVYCPRCGARGAPGDRDSFDRRFCWRCFDGGADADRAAEIIAAAPQRWDARRMLGAITDRRALAALLDALAATTPDLQRPILGSIGAIGDAAAVPVVIGLLDEPELATRRAAVRTLGDLGGRIAVDALARLLGDPELVTIAAEALAWHRDGRGFDALLDPEADPHAMGNAARTPLVALTWLGDRRAIPVLVQRLAELEAGHRSADDIWKWRLKAQADEIAGVLLHFGGDEATAAVDRARSRIDHLNPSPPNWVRPARRFATLADDLDVPGRTVPRWSLELTEVDAPITEPVTKFGGQPVWIDQPTWPLTNDGTPMPFFAQFVVPDSDGLLAYLFIDPDDERNGRADGGANALFVQPGGRPERFEPRRTGPTYVSSRTDMSRFVPRQRLELVERRARLAEGRDPLDWTSFEARGSGGEADWNKVGGSPRWLQNPQRPPGEGWRFLFQFTANSIGHEFADGAECYGHVAADGRGAFVWQCH